MRVTGFSLLELLVSLFILSIGLLGLAALESNAIKFGYDAHLRSIAITQISDIADRMRANRSGVESGAYNNGSGIPTMPSCTTCNFSEIAAVDLHEWNQSNANLLPNGQGIINGNNQVFTVTIMWDHEKTGATGTNCSGNSNVDLTCLRVNVNL